MSVRTQIGVAAAISAHVPPLRGYARTTRASLLAGTALAGSLFASLTILPTAAMAASECGAVGTGANYTVGCGQGPYNSGITYGNAQTGTADNTIFDFSNTQATGTSGHAATSLSSGKTGASIEVDIRQLSPGPAPDFQGGTGADGFSVTTSGTASPIIFNMGAGSITGGGASFLSGGANGVALSTSGTNSAVTFDLTGGTITGGGPTSLIIVPTNSNGVVISTTKSGSDINFATSAGTSITAAYGNGVQLNAGGGSSIGSNSDNNTINGTITSTQTLLGIGVGTGWLGTATGSGDVTQNVGKTGDVSGSGAGLVGTTVNGDVTFVIDGQVNQTSTVGGTLTAPLTLPVGIGGVASGSGSVSITTDADSSVSQVGHQALTNIEGAGILGITLGTGSTTLEADGSVTATGVGVGAISNSGNSTVTIGGEVSVTGASGSKTAFVLPTTVGAYALSASGAATTNVYGGNIGSATAGTSPDIGAAAIVLGGTADATVNIGDGVNPASTIYANELGAVAFNAGSGNALITNTLDPDSNQNTVNSGGLGMLGVTTGTGNVVVDAGIINSGLNNNGGFASSGVVGLALGGGDATVNLHGNVTTNGGTFGALAFSNGGNVTTTSDAGIIIDPPIGMASVTLGPGLATVTNNATVNTTVIGLLGANFGDGAVLITNSTTGDVEASTGAGIVALKIGPNSNPVVGYTDPITSAADYSVVVANTGIVNAPAGPGVGVIAFDPTTTAVNNVLVSNDGSAGNGTGSITGAGDSPLDAAVGVAADGNIVIVNDHNATITNTTGDSGLAVIVLAGDSVSVTNDHRSSITGTVDIGSLTGDATLTNDRGSNLTFDGISIVGAAGQATITNSRGATIDEEGTSALVALGGTGATITNETGARINGDGTVNAVAAVALSGDATITNETGGRIDLTGANALAALAFDGNATINNETRGRIDLTGLNANVVFGSDNATINNFDGAHLSLNGVNANVVVAQTGTAEINNYNGAHFSLNGLTGNVLVAQAGEADIENYNGAHLNLAGVSGSLVGGYTGAVIDNYNGGHLNLLGGNAIAVTSETGNAVVDNYDGGQINMIGLNKITLTAANGTEEFDNEANSTIFNDGVGTIAGSNNLQFNNSGLITEIDGHTGDILTIDPATFTATGNSQLGVDSYLGGPGSTSDRMFVNGNVTGLTSIIVNDVNSGPGAYNPKGIAIVDVTGTGTAVGGNNANWVLDPTSSHYDTLSGTPVLDKGLFAYFLAQDPTGNSQGCVDGAGQCVSLYSVPGQVAHELPIAITAAQNLWQETALMWEDRQSEIRDWLARPISVQANSGLIVKGPLPPQPVQGSGPGIWAKAIGSWTTRNNTSSESLAGHTFNFDLGYKQNSFGLIGGADFGKAGVLRPDDALIFGAMGGYVQSHLNFNQGGTSFVYSGGTVGVSASYIAHGFFIDGLAKADLLRLQINTPWMVSSPDATDFGGASVGINTVGGIGNIGYRFDTGRYFFEPIGTLTYSATRIGSVNALQALGANVNFGNGDSLRGAIGGRVGVELPGILPGHTMEAWIMGRLWDEFLGNANSIDIQNAGPDAILADNFQKVFGEVKGGVTLITPIAGWSGFVDAGVKFNEQFNTVTAKGGLNYQW